MDVNVEAAIKKLAKTSSGWLSAALVYEDGDKVYHINRACHAFLHCSHINEDGSRAKYVVTYINHTHLYKDKEAVKEFYSYLFHDSPYAIAYRFVEEIYKDYSKDGIPTAYVTDCTQPGNLMQAANILPRYAIEYINHHTIRWWKLLVDSGVDKDDTLFFCHFAKAISVGSDSFTSAHQAISSTMFFPKWRAFDGLWEKPYTLTGRYDGVFSAFDTHNSGSSQTLARAVKRNFVDTSTTNKLTGEVIITKKKFDTDEEAIPTVIKIIEEYKKECYESPYNKW